MLTDTQIYFNKNKKPVKGSSGLRVFPSSENDYKH